MPKYFATRPILIGKPAKRLEEGEECTLDKDEAQPLLDKGALVSPADWKRRQMPADAQESLAAANERAAAFLEENKALRKQIEKLEGQVSELAESLDKAEAGVVELSAALEKAKAESGAKDEKKLV